VTISDNLSVISLEAAIVSSEKKELIREAIRNRMDFFYVYILRRPNGSPFYVGKGKNDRVFNHESAAINTTAKSYKLNIIRAIKRENHSVRYEISSFHQYEAEAHQRECLLIKQIGRHDLGTGTLANLTDGGEGAVNLSEESKQKHRDTLYGTTGEDERSIANRFFMKLMSVESVTIKPLKSYKPEPLSPMNKPLKNFTPRMAASLAASAIANRVILEEGCILPRLLMLGDSEYVIENGVGKDILKVDMAALIPARLPKNESLRLNRHGLEYILKTIDRNLLLDAGVLMPKNDAE
jgi:hypothetical protein